MENKYNEFIKKYKLEHELCPKCGHKEYSSTLFTDVVFLNNIYDYKDSNICICNKCNYKHITHDRISLNSFNKSKKK